jgi:hypothetical protein
MAALRREAALCDVFAGVVIMHSMSGGTGVSRAFWDAFFFLFLFFFFGKCFTKHFPRDEIRVQRSRKEH